MLRRGHAGMNDGDGGRLQFLPRDEIRFDAAQGKGDHGFKVALSEAVAQLAALPDQTLGRIVGKTKCRRRLGRHGFVPAPLVWLAHRAAPHRRPSFRSCFSSAITFG